VTGRKQVLSRQLPFEQKSKAISRKARKGRKEKLKHGLPLVLNQF
jgi:hypothetical protein